MRECLQEEVLQSYLDGELGAESMEHVTAHLAACLECSDAARQLEQENRFLASALASEFAAVVPSERLRQRIDAAIAEDRLEAAITPSSSATLRNWFSSLSDLFAFKPQRALAYASVVLVVGFALVMAMMKLQSSPVSTGDTPVAQNAPAPNNSGSTSVAVNGSNNSDVTVRENHPIVPATVFANVGNRPLRRAQRSSRSVAPTASGQNEMAANHVKLLPGERSYLQTIAQLDTTIKSDKTRLAPAVQAEFQRNLAVVDRTLAVARTAAKTNPNDPDAAEFMFSAYQSKVDLLNTVAEARVFDKQH